MISSSSYKLIQIDITFVKEKKRKRGKIMDNDKFHDKKYCRDNQNRFICSICLNKKSPIDEDRGIECYKRKSRSCPVCQRSYDVDEYADSIVKKDSNVLSKYEDKGVDSCPRKCNQKKEIYGKNIQTSQADVTQGLTLLNEVLTVFQNKKEVKKEKPNRTIILKDACVSTDTVFNAKPKLTLSKVIHYSIEANERNVNNCKFTILNHEPENVTKSISINLSRHKSSSIPQMKLEELKKSLKEKTKSKDAIEEVNRMFATVKKLDTTDNLIDSNRPMIRNGPRVLPVVKTDCHEENISRNEKVCKCNLMSGGDSIKKQDGWHKMEDKCDECVCISCCRRLYHRPLVSEACNHCKNRTDRS